MPIKKTKKKLTADQKVRVRAETLALELRKKCHAPGCTRPHHCPELNDHSPECKTRLNTETAVFWQLAVRIETLAHGVCGKAICCPDEVIDDAAQASIIHDVLSTHDVISRSMYERINNMLQALRMLGRKKLKVVTITMSGGGEVETGTYAL